ncbi:MAG: hypothetical protein ACYC8S_03160 [Minisyncoccota bacterium]
MAENSTEDQRAAPAPAPAASASVEAPNSEDENPPTRTKEATPLPPAPEGPLVGRLKIAYNQFWMERHEKKAAALKEEVDRLTIRGDILQASKKGIESEAGGLRGENIPGGEVREINIREVDKQRNEILNKRDALQSMFEERYNKVKLYTNERDRIVDAFVNEYDEKLVPMEQELERLQTKNNQADLDVAVLEARHRARIADLKEIEDQKTHIEGRLRNTRMKDTEIARAVQHLSEIISRGRNDIRTERERLTIQKNNISKKIAEIDARANPYRDKREKFVRIKSGRPIAMNANERVKEEPFLGREDARAHPRAEAPQAAPSPDSSQDDVLENGGSERESGGEHHSTAAYVALWNEHLAESHRGESKGKIDVRDFLFLTTLRAADILNFKEFKDIALKYYKLKKVSAVPFTEEVWAEFFGKATKEEQGNI